MPKAVTARRCEAVDRAAELSAGGGVAMQVDAGCSFWPARAGPQEARAGLAALEQQAAARKIRLSHRDRAYVKLALGDESGACDEFEQSFDERESALSGSPSIRALIALRPQSPVPGSAQTHGA